LQARRQYVLFFMVVAAVAAGGFWVARQRASRASDPLSAVPHDAWLVVTVDVAALRRSALAQPLLGSGAVPLPGVGSLVDVCGFDPVSRIDSLMLCSPEGGQRGDFGLAIAGGFTRNELGKCADKVIHARGGTPITSTRGTFAVLDSGDADHTRFAYRDGGPFLVGRGPWLDAMIDAADGKAERIRPEHEALRSALASAASASRGAPVAMATALLPSSIRQRLRAELGSEGGGDEDRVYASVLAVQAAGLAIGTGGAGSTTDVTAELRCDTDDACSEVKNLALRKRMAFSRDLGMRVIGLGPLLDSFAVDAKGSAVSASAHVPTDDLARAAARLLDYRPDRGDRPSPAPSRAGSAPPTSPGGASVTDPRDP
jgi:hypothetical protein